MDKINRYIKKPVILYPVIISIFPLVALYNRNMWTITFYEVMIAILLILILMGILWWMLRKITKSIHKSALIVSVFFILFFSFGHFLPAVSDMLFDRGIDIRSQVLNYIGWKLQVLLIVWVLVFLLLLFLISRVKSDFRLITTFMNGMSVCLAIFTVFQSTRIFLIQQEIIQDSETNRINAKALIDQKPLVQVNPQDIDSPDIYYIILDGYGSGEILDRYYGYDNQEFLTFLSENGFFTSSSNHSNYSQTMISLASSLNMQYIINTAQQLGIHSQNPLPLRNLVKGNYLNEFLSSQGYTTVAFETGFATTELTKADYFLSPTFTLTAFQDKLINLTPLSILIRNYPYDSHRKRTRFVFDQLPPSIQTDQPLFVFAHIIAPHPPFVFDQNGNDNNPDMIYTAMDGNFFTDISGRDAYVQQYRDQLIYINSQLKETIDKLLSTPGQKPIIIIQGDHGPGSMLDWGSVENSNIEERMSILNAYYFPDQDYSNLYPQITPVNSFRVILDQYFGTNFGLLEDRSYFSLGETPYDFIDVTDRIATPK